MWRSSFHSKCSKFNIDFKWTAKKSENVFCFWNNCIWIDIVKLYVLRTGRFSSVANVLTKFPKIWHVNKRDFCPNQFPWQWSMNMIKVLWCRIQHCLCTFTFLLVEISFDTGLFTHLDNHVFGTPSFRKYKSCEGHLFIQND